MGRAQQEDLLRLSTKNFEHLVRSIHNDGSLLRQCGVIGPERYTKMHSKRELWRVGRIRCQPFSIAKRSLICGGGDDPDVRSDLTQYRSHFSSRETAEPPPKLRGS